MDTSSNRMGAYASVALLVWFLMAVIGGWMEHSQRAWQNPEVRARAGPAQEIRTTPSSRFADSTS